MSSILFRRTGIGACLIFFSFSLSTAQATASSEASKLSTLAGFVERALAANLQIQAAGAAVDAQAARSRGASRPLFNPALELEYENSDIDITTLELSQTLDWHDKRGARKSATDAQLQAIQSGHQALREQLAGDILTALANLDHTTRLQDLAAKRLSLLERFVSLNEQRAAAGDIGQTELQLARLAQAEAHLQYAEVAGELIERRTTLSQLAGTLPARPLTLPARPPAPSLDTAEAENLATQHPAVREAQLRALAAKRQIRMIDHERRADPTIGLKGGREDRQNLIGLRLEIPLQVRNDFGEEVEAAQAEALQAEREAQDSFRGIRYRLQGAHRRLIITQQALTQWKTQGQRSLKGYVALLERLWQAGEIGSADYLLQLRQALDTRIAGESVRGKAWLAWADWLSAAGQVQHWLGIRQTGVSQ